MSSTSSSSKPPAFPWVPFGISVTLAAHGLRKKSLAPSGAATALVVGFLTMAAPLRTFGISLIVFYLLGSRATKLGKALKNTLEEGHQEAGYRDGMQVLSNSVTALIAATVWSITFTPISVHAWLYSIAEPSLGPSPLVSTVPYTPFTRGQWCAVDSFVADGWSRKLIFIALGHFACCLGDTLASEIGILSKQSPVLITTFRKVPPGTNGGLSTLGTGASLIGGAIMGLTFALSMLWENPACRLSSGPLGPLLFIVKLVAYGAFAGLFGSGLDSLLGATVQRTRYSTGTKRILQDHSAVTKESEKEVKVISGLNILTNNQVNVVSSFFTALLLGWLA
ncbi:hypothetical protein FRB99_004345 [Tulasnella sp. 403]|nr:hypothetical protein FRB99_004345 [Tulasnella sp. 403]